MSKINDLIKKMCPNGVRFDRLENVTLLQAGDRITTAMMSDDFQYDVIGGGTLPTGKYNDYNREHCITISRAGSAGYVNWMENKFWATDVCFTAIKNNDYMNIKFIYHYLKNAQKDLQQHIYGGSMPKLEKLFLWKYPIPIPPLAVQEEIVRILDKFSELEAELEAELEVRKNQYEFWREKLLKSDKNTVKLKDITSIITKGTTPTSIGFNFEIDGEVNFVKIESINNGMFNLNKLEHISNDCNEKLSRSKLQENDILFSIAGAIGKTIIVDNSILPANTNQALAIIRISDSNYNIKYINYYLNSSYIKTQYTDKQKGSAQINVSLNDISNFEIPEINIDEQNRIVNILDKFESLINDISVGLPAEIELRRKQYEYYRNKLLSFEELNYETVA